MITIFSTNPPRPEKCFSAVAASLLVHCVVFVVVALAVTYSHTDISKRKTRKYSVRFVHLQLFDPVQDQAALKPVEQAPRPRGTLSSARYHIRAKQTLIRPDVPPDVVLKQEIPIADLAPQSLKPPPPIPKINQAAATADVIAIPNAPLRPQDLLVIPPANQIASSAPREPQPALVGSPVLTTSRLDSRLLTLNLDSQPVQSGLTEPRPQGSGNSAGSQPAASQRASSETRGDTSAFIRITQPKSGKFGIVVSGSSASDLLPEGVDALNGEMLYTVYLRVGLRKNWILQYCLPKDAEPGGEALDAPWPFLMLRPDPLVAADLDYIVVRGIINSTGRFEQLRLVYPADLSQQEKLLGALQQWNFRPASRGSRAVAVEALLVIPGQSESAASY